MRNGPTLSSVNIHLCLTITLCVGVCPYTSVRDCHQENQIVAVKVQNPWKCLLKTLRMFSVPWPKQNIMTGASLRHPSLYLWVSSISPDRERKDRERGGRERERRGPEVCLGGRWLSVAVNRWLFDAIVSAQACLSRSVTAIKDSLTAKTGARVETQGNPHTLIYTWHKLCEIWVCESWWSRSFSPGLEALNILKWWHPCYCRAYYYKWMFGNRLQLTF